MRRKGYAERLQLWKAIRVQCTDDMLQHLPIICKIVLDAHYEGGRGLKDVAQDIGQSYYMARHYHDYGLFLLKQQLKGVTTH